MTDDDYDALSQKQLASIKRDMRISLEDAAVRATYKVMAELETEQEPVATLDDLEQEIYENTRQFVSRDVMEWMLKRYYTTPPQRKPLTDEEIMNIAKVSCIGISPHEDTLNFAKVIEAVHGIKE